MKTHQVEELIRLEAFLLSEKAGHPHGMDAIFWTQAEEIVRARSMKVSKTAKPKAAAPKKAVVAVKKAAPPKAVAAKAPAPVPAKAKPAAVSKAAAPEAKAPATKKPAAKAKGKSTGKVVAEQGNLPV